MRCSNCQLTPVQIVAVRFNKPYKFGESARSSLHTMSSSPQCSRGIAQPAARWANARHKENTPPQLATPQLEELLLAAQGTPRSARTSGLALSPKHPQFTEMFSEQMDQRTVEVPAEKWMDCFLSSNRPTEEELAGLPKYTSLKSTGKKRSKLQESTIYPTLVFIYFSVANSSRINIDRRW